MNETTKKVLCYTLTPQIMPRIKGLFFSGFSHVAFFMAQVYRAARLLPPGHPYLNTANMGRFGIRHVIAEAASNLVLRKENIDQIVIFLMLLLGMLILFFQMAMLCMALFVGKAHAFGLPWTFEAYFLVPDATNDIAFVLLDRVFGIPDMFVDRGGGTTCVVQNTSCFDLGQSTRELTQDRNIATDYDHNAFMTIPFPWPFHDALHNMLELYSIGLLLIAVFIFIYFVAAIVAETAQTGTPFGRRFNHVWAPLRIVAAMGALVPLTYGLNSTQWILMWAAKWGSGFATNGWIYFSNMATGDGTLLGPSDTLVATPNAPPVNTLLEFFSVVATCKTAYELMYHERENAGGRDPVVIDAWLVNPVNPGAPAELLTDNLALADALDFFNNGDIIVRFGEQRDQQYQTNAGRVVPYCGEIKLQITDVDEATQPGAYLIEQMYYTLIQTLWTDASTNAVAGCGYDDGAGGGAWNFGCIGYNVTHRYLPIQNNPNLPLPGGDILEAIRGAYQYYVNNTILGGVDYQKESPEWLEQLGQLGWGGAAIWYNKIAQMNGSLTGAAFNLPSIQKYPAIMEKIRRQKANSDTDAPGGSRHQVSRGADSPLVLSDEEETQIGKVMYQTQKLWTDFYAEGKPGGNIFMDIINGIFGTAGLFNMQNNADQRVHPLAQLTSIGRTIIDTSIRNLGYSAAAGLGGGIVNLLGGHMVGRVAMTASGFLVQIAMVGFSIGFVLFYVIPFLPFIYYFFAVGGWIKGIFEAMVGVPLWAMAHIRIDGNGLPGDAALGGYYLVLEIFLRPICIVFGFLASITIFSAQVQILHEIWPLVVSNATGFDVNAAQGLNVNETGGMRFLRGALDKLFFTVIYAIMVYMLGMSSFKLIDMVPNHILRWMGASISTFGEQSGDPAENLVRNSFVGSRMLSGQLGSAVSGLRNAAGQSGQAIGELAGRAGR